MHGYDVKVILGCEIHIQLLTKTKAFCSCPNLFGGKPNTYVCPICLGLPGVLPNLNIELVKKGVQVAHVLGCSIERDLRFDRKHYMYPDLTKGYQITQHNYPIGYDGVLTFLVEGIGERKTVRIQRVHMEEDTGKSLHVESLENSYIDYNRGGTPLLEIVSYPDMNSSREVVTYAKIIREMVHYLGFSDGNMEEGSFRCDVNVNLHLTKDGRISKTPITELKNINSFRKIQGAIEYEIIRQKEEFEKIGITLEKAGKQTRGWNNKLRKTFLQRQKEAIGDYHYMREPDIPLIRLDSVIVQGWLDEIGELPEQARERMKKEFGLSDFDVFTLTSDVDLVHYFEEAVKGAKDPKKIANWILTEVASVLNKKAQRVCQFQLKPQAVTELVNLVSDGKISGMQAKEVFSLMIESQRSAKEIIAEQSFSQMQDLGEIEVIVDKVLASNAKSVADYKAGKEAALKYLMGQVMRESQGKANPVVATEWILKKLSSN